MGTTALKTVLRLSTNRQLNPSHAVCGTFQATPHSKWNHPLIDSQVLKINKSTYQAKRDTAPLCLHSVKGNERIQIQLVRQVCACG